MSPENNIARQATKGSLYSVSAAAVTLVLGFVRTTLMLRLLLPADFGVTTLALFYINLAVILANFGFDSAFIHHKAVDETVRRTFFTLRMSVSLGGLLLMALLTPLIASFYPEVPGLTAVMLLYIPVAAVREFNQSQLAILNKNLAFRQIAQTDVASSLVMTLVGPGLAWLGWGVWAIVAELFSGLLTRMLIIQLAYRPWRPRLGWQREQVRWFWDYGKKAWHGSNMAYFLGNFDNWYVGTFLGNQPLGYYSRAYEYAGYSQRVIANPIMNVFYPTFAHIQGDRQKLSRAFFRPISLMIRAGGLFCLIFILTAPEFIPLLLGEKWLPMLRVFQLLILYSLLEPLSMGARNLLLATGYPQEVVRARLVQMALFIPAVFLFGYRFNIEGVAMAANLMAIAGTLLLFRYTRRVVDYSPRLLWFWPLLAMVVTAVLVLALNPLWQSLNLWLSLALKIGLMTAVYGLILYATEREQLNTGRKMIWGIIAPMLKERWRLGD
jgi:O-antigen/teichoic acid export membrane protein